MVNSVEEETRGRQRGRGGVMEELCEGAGFKRRGVGGRVQML